MSPFVVYSTRRTALHCASYGGFADTMSLLLESQANPNLQDNEVGRERECKVWGQLWVFFMVVSTARQNIILHITIKYLVVLLEYSITSWIYKSMKQQITFCLAVQIHAE